MPAQNIFPLPDKTIDRQSGSEPRTLKASDISLENTRDDQSCVQYIAVVPGFSVLGFRALPFLGFRELLYLEHFVDEVKLNFYNRGK